MTRAGLILACACALGCDSGFAVGVTVERGCLAVPAQLKVVARAEPSGQVAASVVDGKSFFAADGQHRLLVIPPEGATAVKVQVTALSQALQELGFGEVTVAVEGHALVERTLALAGTCNDGFVFPDLAEPDLAMPDFAMPPDLAVVPDLATADRTGCADPSDCTGVTPRCCNNVCFDVASDKGNCGACGVVCDPPHAVGFCMGGVCKSAGCVVGFGDCNNNMGDGCETPVLTDPKNCGACNVGCANGAHVLTVGCQNGACFVAACQPGFADCNKLPGDGCEVDTNADTSNCGGCGAVCVSRFCVSGVCAKRVFVSAANVNGAFGGLAQADQFCNNLANGAQIGGKWQAWLSTANASPSTRFATKYGGPYVRMDGAVIANSFNDLLVDGVKVPINLTESKGAPQASSAVCNNVTTVVWTATDPAGTWDGSGDCASWTMVNSQAGVGNYAVGGTPWTAFCKPVSCITQAPLYCFEQ